MNATTDKFFLWHPDPMWVYDLDSLRFLAVNDAAIDKYGYSRDEFLAMTIADINPEEDRPALEARVASITVGRDESGVWRHRLKSGDIIHVEITGHTIDLDGSNKRLVAARDVTERVVSERALAQAKRMLEIAGNSAKFGAWRYDVATAHLEWSAETARIHDEPAGFSPRVADGILYYVPAHRTGSRVCSRLASIRVMRMTRHSRSSPPRGASSGCVQPAKPTETRPEISLPFRDRFRTCRNW